ncbi:hydroxyethylthiazole kinase [Fructobacillus parabroussonetiae]|uniref:hydroxyethylthiazole kinase n=1 Tax=Fructobacillus parabroussonetiae TaxID=2713174 RepID=A0ABS5QWT2_9LACO|nr:hydroxyethylthiazole kinase [Fructobacillus parabroussonetiae]MBS9337262.1 hypothetical protein [Fructobacillus parabroussonetiae]
MSILEDIQTKPAMVIMNGNHVTEQLVADVISYLGGSPLIAEDYQDDANLVPLSAAIDLNMGTITKSSHQRLIQLGQTANQHGKPIVFDPVGVGASPLRKAQARETFRESFNASDSRQLE